jgi:hypothetical protein
MAAEHKPNPTPAIPDDLAALRDFPVAVKDVAAAIRETTHEAAEWRGMVDTHVTRGEYLVLAVLAFAVLVVIRDWLRGSA